ncbi:hypothetical protein ELI48_02335 [Rhizobium ruizarguesonis]|uniref:hypothetical protein n=1 Tax=Rhizobium ruizarguesonis TaxID=2081791 RepID=UPI00102FE5B8|nr:hypothetical protein [Rhizobium ruizarguesonis]TAU25119.1 hypothetical protein ELI48_02335 [Rhizobium ruizarguesonis]TAU66761.1 hypothetical protein ELI45_02155 [Rhizobium ruizarguesonis]TAW08515.1 hypothetical protein ELI26_02325 [Rhizobium ruizarguesonis]
MQRNLQEDLKRKYPALLLTGLDIAVGDGWHAVLDVQLGDLLSEVPIPEGLIEVTSIRAKDGLCLIEYDALADADPDVVQLFDNACSDVWHHSPLVCECCGRKSGVEGYLRAEPARVRCDECDACSS